MKSTLVRDMQRVAAKKLHNTRGVPRNMKEKLELIDIAFGHAEVLGDFTQWCDENAARSPQYPVTEYLRMIDARLGAAVKVDPADERIQKIVALTYELTAILPRARAVRGLLALHSLDEIESALKAFVLATDEKDMKTALRSFYEDLGASAVIYSMQKRVS